MDASECAHFYFERARSELGEEVRKITKNLGGSDKSLKVDGEPQALPYFTKAQSHWTAYRDNECYSESYSLGQASMRYIVFWQCMRGLTQERINNLRSARN